MLKALLILLSKKSGSIFWEPLLAIIFMRIGESGSYSPMANTLLCFWSKRIHRSPAFPGLFILTILSSKTHGCPFLIIVSVFEETLTAIFEGLYEANPIILFTYLSYY